MHHSQNTGTVENSFSARGIIYIIYISRGNIYIMCAHVRMCIYFFLAVSMFQGV